LAILTSESPCPSGKMLSFYRKEPFELTAKYADPSALPGGINPYIGRFAVKQVGKNALGDPSVVKLKARLTANGTFQFEGAQVHEEVEPSPEPSSAPGAPAEGGDPMETEAQPAAAPEAEAPPPKPKKKLLKKDVPAVYMGTSLDKVVVDELMAKEGDMHAGDKLVAETEDRKNALEEYVYDTRGKLDGIYAPYVTADVKSKFLDELQEAEDWLYSEEGDDASKSQYVARLDGLLKMGGPIKLRQRETEERPRAERALRETISTFSQRVQEAGEKYAHLSEADLQTVVEKCAAAEKWLGDMAAKQAERRKSDDPAYTSAEVLKRRETLVYDCTPIFNKPKPKTSQAPTPDTKKEEQQAPRPEPSADTDMVDADEAPLEQNGAEATPDSKADPGMDID